MLPVPVREVDEVSRPAGFTECIDECRGVPKRRVRLACDFYIDHNRCVTYDTVAMFCLRDRVTLDQKVIGELKRSVVPGVLFGTGIVRISVTGALGGLDADSESALEVDARLVTGDVRKEDSHFWSPLVRKVRHNAALRIY